MSIWACKDCESRFAEPSFSEGPKVVDQETLEVKRFTQARHLCPVCFSPRILPPDRSVHIPD